MEKTVYLYLSLATQKLILEAEGSLSQQCLRCSVVPVAHGWSEPRIFKILMVVGRMIDNKAGGFYYLC